MIAGNIRVVHIVVKRFFSTGRAIQTFTRFVAKREQQKKSSEQVITTFEFALAKHGSQKQVVLSAHKKCNFESVKARHRGEFW